jgi:DNA-binding transcriptional ArsR family regulator
MILARNRVGGTWMHYSKFLAERELETEFGDEIEEKMAILENGGQIETYAMTLRGVHRLERLPGERTPDLIRRALKQEGETSADIIAYVIGMSRATVLRHAAKEEDMEIIRRQSQSMWRGNSVQHIRFCKQFHGGEDDTTRSI